MNMINRHGWEFLLPHDVEVIWDGINDSSSEHVQILNGEFYSSGKRFVHTGTANGTITFSLDCLIETDKDHYCLLSGPPNYFVDGVKPMNGLIRSDWYHFNPIEFSWKITTPNKKITFKKGEAFAFIMNYPKNLINDTNFYIKKANQAEKERMVNYGHARQKFYEENNNAWTCWYRDAKERENKRVLEESQKITPKNPEEIL